MWEFMVMVGWPNDKNNDVRVNGSILNGANGSILNGTIDVIDHALGWMEGVKDVKGKVIHFELYVNFLHLCLVDVTIILCCFNIVSSIIFGCYNPSLDDK